MKQIDIKKPKYIIPILILPFILGIGWLVKDMINSAPAEETTLVETEELNLDIPDANLEKREIEGGNLAASKIRNLECPSYEICLIDYGCGKFNRKIHIMEQYP